MVLNYLYIFASKPAVIATVAGVSLFGGAYSYGGWVKYKRNLHITSNIEDMRKLFVEIDSDNDGSIDKNELKEALLKNGIVKNKLGLTKMFRSVDTDGDGKISVDEWLRMCKNVNEVEGGWQKVLKVFDLTAYEENMLKVFNDIDTNNNGSIDRKELKDMLLKKGIIKSRLGFNKMFKSADLDLDGNISLDEWIILCGKLKDMDASAKEEEEEEKEG